MKRTLAGLFFALALFLCAQVSVAAYTTPQEPAGYTSGTMQLSSANTAQGYYEVSWEYDTAVGVMVERVTYVDRVTGARRPVQQWEGPTAHPPKAVPRQAEEAQ